MKPALGIGLHGINVDLRLVDEAAFRASQGPMLKAGTRRDSALDCHERLASGTARKLGGARRQFGRRRLQIGHGIDPGKVTIGDYITGSRCWGSRAPALGRHFLRARRSVTGFVTARYRSLGLASAEESIATAAPIRIAAIVAPLRTASRESPKSYSAKYPSVIAMQTAAAIVTQSILFSMLHAHAYIASDDGQLGSDVTTIHYSP